MKLRIAPVSELCCTRPWSSNTIRHSNPTLANILISAHVHTFWIFSFIVLWYLSTTLPLIEHLNPWLNHLQSTLFHLKDYSTRWSWFTNSRSSWAKMWGSKFAPNWHRKNHSPDPRSATNLFKKTIKSNRNLSEH